MVVLSCPIKINLTLRVLSLRPDGYHNIFSALWSKKGGEKLTISCYNDENTANDLLEIKGLHVEGPNLVTKAISWARKRGAVIPPLYMQLLKLYPPGSGIGAGSGNAAAAVMWACGEYGIRLCPEDVLEIGADVSFLASGNVFAFAEGTGERIRPVCGSPGLVWVLGFPNWTSSTGEAYSLLDGYGAARGEVCSGGRPEEEALGILEKLSRKDFVGLLPNDFLMPALVGHREYEDAFNAARASASLAWGLCGSGSAFFALCGDEETASKTESLFKSMSWVIKTARVE